MKKSTEIVSRIITDQVVFETKRSNTKLIIRTKNKA